MNPSTNKATLPPDHFADSFFDLLNINQGWNYGIKFAYGTKPILRVHIVASKFRHPVFGVELIRT